MISLANRIRALSTVACLCPLLLAAGSEPGLNRYAHTAWTPRDSALRGGVNCITQTPDGYLWIATETGLVRFDGVHMTPWKAPPGQVLPGGPVSVVYAARDGALWIGTWEGLASWKNGKLTIYPAFAKSVILALLEDRDGTIWVGTLGFPVGRICSVRDGNATCFGDDGRFGNGVISFYQDAAGFVWAGAASGLWRWKTGPPERYLPNPFSDGLSLVAGDRDGELVAVLKPGLVRRIANGRVSDYPLPGAPSSLVENHLLRDREGALWIGTDTQGIVYSHNGSAGMFTHSDGLSSDQVRCFFQDREGTIWVGTNDGLDSFTELPVASLAASEGLSSNTTGAVLAARDGSVWIGTRTGLNRWKDGRIRTYRTQTDTGLPDNEIGSLFQDDGGRIWVSGGHGLSIFDNGKFTPVPAIPTGQTNAITSDRQGGLWLSLDLSSPSFGLVHLVEGKVTERMPWSKVGGTPGSGLVADDDGVWTGLLNGGIVYFHAGEIRKFPLGESQLATARVFNISSAANGVLWISGESGLSRFANGHVLTLNAASGLPCDAVYWEIEDNASSYWVYTRCGLVRIATSEINAWIANPGHKVKTTVFDSSEGIQLIGIPSPYRPHVSKAQDGKIWFQNGNKVGIVDSSRNVSNTLAPPVHIEQIVGDDKTYPPSPGLHLPPLVRNVVIDYTALSFVAPDKVHFRFKLEGQDPDWREVVNDREVQYSNLRPARYRFHVIASNNSGLWNEAGDTLEFSVDPMYYQTLWFQALVIAGLLALLGLFYRYRLQQLSLLYSARLEERVEERIRIARDLHDTLLQTFQGLMIRFQVVNELLGPGKAKDELEQTLEFGDRAVVEARDAVHDLRASATTTNDLVEALRGVADELAPATSSTIRFIVEGSPRELQPIVRDEIYRIGREALRNAVTHGFAGSIEVQITYQERSLRFVVRDDGNGIPPHVLETGKPGHYGLAGMRERARAIGAELKISSAQGFGTEIDLTVPRSIAYAKRSGHSSLPFQGEAD